MTGVRKRLNICKKTLIFELKYKVILVESSTDHSYMMLEPHDLVVNLALDNICRPVSFSGSYPSPL